ncbi:hypothetical protein [Pseudomonas sp.]|uniref:hypothetical protein n=1 Tax=Pseudomonas sp. TaxID=306 RepID=UPI00333F99DD
MIYVPSGRFLEAELSACSQLSGRFILEKAKADNNGNPIEATRVKVAEFDNIITNQGLNRIGTNNDWLRHIQVGSGTATPAATDTGLASFVAGTDDFISTSSTIQSSPPYYATRTLTRRFVAGAAAGNLSEVGIGWASTGSALFSRALILDGGGVPTTITVLSDEVLDVTYQIRIYPPANDVSGSITVTGVGTVSTTTRASIVTSAGNWAINQNGVQGGPSDLTNNHRAYTGAIGVITAQPSGTNESASTASLSAYSNNSFQRDATITWGLGAANFGINSIQFSFGPSFEFGLMQVGLGTTITKNNTQTLSLNARHQWARRTL